MLFFLMLLFYSNYCNNKHTNSDTVKKRFEKGNGQYDQQGLNHNNCIMVDLYICRFF